MDTPVVLIIFNRPEHTRKTLAAIRQARPKTLFVIADGPRPNVPSDSERTSQSRALLDTVDWECTVLKNYADTNMGCRERVASGLTWVFNTVTEAIILEDDCIADPSFFRFCTDLLERYRDDKRIMQIGGFNPLVEQNSRNDSYFFSIYGTNWGWATWSRAWQYYDVDISLWARPEVQQHIRDAVIDKKQFKRRSRINWDTYHNKIDTWDFQWTFARLLQSGLGIVPVVNLVQNIGFGTDATHYHDTHSPMSLPNTMQMSFPLQHPLGVTPDRKFDRRLDSFRHSLGLSDYMRIAFNKARRITK